jgi:hypothetical protein
MRMLILDTVHPEFLSHIARGDPGLAARPFDDQMGVIFGAGFGDGDGYSHGLRRHGVDAIEVVVNADDAQQRWAAEHGVAVAEDVRARRRAIVEAQIAHLRPDVLYVQEWCPLGDEFLASIRRMVPLVVGQLGSPPRRGRTYAAYDLIVSCWPPLVSYFRARGTAAQWLPLAFDERILERLGPIAPTREVTFVGGLTADHPERVPWLERLMEETPVEVFGYGMETTRPDSPIRRVHGGAAWGMDMYRVLRESRVTLNLHVRMEIDGVADKTLAANLRLYEATGVGTCLITDRKRNLDTLFEEGREVLAFDTPDECVEVVRTVLADEPRRRAIAEAGQRRTLADHTLTRRMGELAVVLARHPRTTRRSGARVPVQPTTR